jgi:hypothetical protein
MDWSWGRAAELAATISAFGALASMARASMGSWRGLRNPWVRGWLALASCSILALVLLSGGVLPLPTIDRSILRNLLLVVMILALTTPFMAVWAGFRHQHRIDRILGVFGREEIMDADSDAEAALIREHAEALRDLDTLRELQPIVARTGGAPQYPWLTPEWLEDRIEGIRLGRIDRMTS